LYVDLFSQDIIFSNQTQSNFHIDVFSFFHQPRELAVPWLVNK